MADKMMRNAVRGPDGIAKAMQGDEDGNIYVTDRPLKRKELIDEPFTLNKGDTKVVNISNAAKTVSFIGLTDISSGEIDIALSNLIDNSSLPYKYKEKEIRNKRFETDIFISKSDTIRITLRNNYDNPIQVEKLF